MLIAELKRTELEDRNACVDGLALFDGALALQNARATRGDIVVEVAAKSVVLAALRAQSTPATEADHLCYLHGAGIPRYVGDDAAQSDTLRIDMSPTSQVWCAVWVEFWPWMIEEGLLPCVSAPRADLRGAYLSGAARYTDDAIIPGWTLRDGRLVREVSP